MKRFRANSGQTILEIVIALTLIILFLSGVVVIELSAIKNVQYAQNKSVAVRLARQQIQRARVARDSNGIDTLTLYCSSNCYLNELLSPAPSPTGAFAQSLRVTTASFTECPLPEISITPEPVSYKVEATINWGFGQANLTPPPQLSLSSCITDWR